MIEVIFMAHGLTGVFRKGKQVPELQQSWLLLFAQYLIDQGIDAKDIVFGLPNGARARLFTTSEGNLNYEFTGWNNEAADEVTHVV